MRRERRPVLALLAQPHPLATHEPFRSRHHTKGKPMTPEEIRRSWDDDDTPRSVFPEPLAEGLTRENKELRAEVERLRGEVAGMTGMRNAARRARDEADARLDVLVADLRGLLPDRDYSESGDVWLSVKAAALRAVLDKHAGEQP